MVRKATTPAPTTTSGGRKAVGGGRKAVGGGRAVASTASKS